MSDLAAILSALPDEERRAALTSLSASELAALEYCWPVWARKDQLAPPGPWRTWVQCAGRGSGKTKSSAEATRAEIEAGRRVSVGLIGPTADTLRRDQAAALLQASPPWCRPIHEASQRRMVWPNGAYAYLLSSEEPDRIRGLNLDWAWVDELTSLANQADVWSNLQLALRVKGPTGADPAAIVSTTPKRQPLLKAIMAHPSSVVTRASTFDNAANLSQATLDHLTATLGGTTLGRQELFGDLLDDLDGALWNRAMLDACRVKNAPDDLKRIVVAIDPAGTSGKNSDETGIIVAGVDRAGIGYVLADLSGKYSPDGWARKAVNAYHAWHADKIVVETNFGADMCVSTINSVDQHVPVKKVTASRGKQIRAEPISALYEQRRIKHLASLDLLEDQMCGWDPAENGPSPDRVDALVWALTELIAGPQNTMTIHRLPY